MRIEDFDPKYLSLNASRFNTSSFIFHVTKTISHFLMQPVTGDNIFRD